METEEERAAREAEELKKKQEEEFALAKKQEEEDLLKKQQEEGKSRADKLLDGTDRDKNITIKKDKYDDRNEKAKILEAYAPLLDKVLKDPELVERLLETQEKGDVESRLRQLEEERKSEKRTEMRNAVNEMIERWGKDFENSWVEVEPIVVELYKKGIPYKKALRNTYLAFHPEAIEVEAKRLTSEALNREGNFSEEGGFSPNVNRITSPTKLTEDEKKIGKALGMTEENYVKLLEKWKDSIEKDLRRL